MLETWRTVNAWPYQISDQGRFRELNDLCGEVSDEHMLGDVTVVVRHGGCPTGADRWADEWGVVNMARMEIFEAEWDKYGRSAGPIRNRQMCAALPRPDLCLAFPGGAGTRNCMFEARDNGIPVRKVGW